MDPELIIVEQEEDVEVIMGHEGDAEDSPKGRDCRDTTGNDIPRNLFGSGADRRKRLLGLVSAAFILTLSLVLGFVARPRSNEGESPKSRGSILRGGDSSSLSLSPSVSDLPTSSPTETSGPSITISTAPSLSPSVSAQPSTSPTARPTLSGAPSLTPSEAPSLSGAPSSIPSGEPSFSGMPSSEPSNRPSTSQIPSGEPSLSGMPSTNPPTLSFGPTQSPSTSPSTSPTASPSTSSQPTPAFIDPRCFTVATYNSIDRDVARIAENIESLVERSHFFGGIVRLVAHDFMDYDPTSTPMYGPDGCFDRSHGTNSGLPEDIWCDDCPLTRVYNQKYRPNKISRGKCGLLRSIRQPVDPSLRTSLFSGFLGRGGQRSHTTDLCQQCLGHEKFVSMGQTGSIFVSWIR